jgi:hypothetical protein
MRRLCPAYQTASQEWRLERRLGAHSSLIRAQGCIVEWEGLKKGKYWVFNLVGPDGLLLVRASSE